MREGVVGEVGELDLGVLMSDTAGEVEGAISEVSVFWVPPQGQSIACLKDTKDVLREYGCEFEATVNSGDADGGDLDRRRAIVQTMENCAGEAAAQCARWCTGEVLPEQWARYTLRRLSCRVVEQVTASVRANGKFTCDVKSADALSHCDVLFMAYVGLRARRELQPSLEELYACGNEANSLTNRNRHPMVPPIELQQYFSMSWAAFVDDMCNHSASTVSRPALLVAAYAAGLVRFLIPSYVFELGPVPDPSLWGFRVTSADIEALYHGHLATDTLDTLREDLDRIKVTAPMGALSLQAMWALARSTHALLWGLNSNDRRLLKLFQENRELLSGLALRYGVEGSSFPYLDYLVSMKRVATAARECGCANQLPWRRGDVASSNSECTSRHNFYATTTVPNADEFSSTRLSEALLVEISSWGEGDFVDAMWRHCNDRVGSVGGDDPSGALALSAVWKSLLEHHPDAAQNRLRLGLLLGAGHPTSDPRIGVGYTRMASILSSALCKLILDVRHCHVNGQSPKRYWRDADGERDAVYIRYGSSALVLHEVVPPRLSSRRIIDIGLNLGGRYGIRRSNTVGHTMELDYVCADDVCDNGPHAPLREFLLSSARERMRLPNGKRLMLHGYCDGAPGAVHEVKVSVELPIDGNRFEDLVFGVSIDNVDAWRASVVTIQRGGDSAAFLRFGVLLHDTGIELETTDVVLESAECLSGALDAEALLGAPNTDDEPWSSEQRAIAMQISPAMLTQLPKTKHKLDRFLRDNVAPRMPSLVPLFLHKGTRILGLSAGDMLRAKVVLVDIGHAATDVFIDDLSFATHYDGIRELGEMSGLTVVCIILSSPLSRSSVHKLVNLTRRSSLRYIVEASTMSADFFEDESVSDCCVQLAEEHVLPIDTSRVVGRLIQATSRRVMESDGTAAIGSIRPTDQVEWASLQLRALTLHASALLADRSRLVIVVCGDHPCVVAPTSGTAPRCAVVVDLQRQPDQYLHIQELLQMRPHTPIVVAVHSLDPSCTSFIDADGVSPIEPVIFRPDLVIKAADSERAARLLGCRPRDVDLGNALVQRVLEATSSETTPKDIPTFFGFVYCTPLCEFLSQWARVALYLHCFVLTGYAFADTVTLVRNACNNTFCRSIWESVRRSGSSPQTEPADVVVRSTHVTKSAEELIFFALRDGLPVSARQLEEWLKRLPSPTRLREYMSLSLSPLSVFALNPTVAVQLLSQSLVRHGMWLRRLTEGLRCAQCTDAALADVAGSPFMSAARWVATSAGERVCGDAGSDLDNLSALGIVLTPATHADLRGQDVEFLHRILALNSDTALQHQHWLRSFLSNAPSRGGVSLASAERLHEAPLFGTVFARLILDADPGSAMVVGDVRQLLSWVRGSTSSAAFPTAAVTSEELLRRFTPEGQVELLLAAADAKEQKWSRVCGLVEAIQPTPGGIVKMIAWCHRRCQLTRGGAQHVAAVLQFYGIASGVPTESTLSNIDHRSAYAQLAVRCATCQFPLLPLDSSPSAAVFSSWLAAAFLEAIRSILFRDTPHGLAHPTLDNFTRACVFAEASATPSSHRRAMEAIHAQIVVDASSKWVHSVLWAVEPLASAVLTTADADILLCMSSHLESPGPTQRRFSATVKDNIGTVSCLALALIGRVEFVRATMLVALGARHGMWGGRIRVETPQCHRFLDPQHIDGGDRITPAYAVSFLPRVLPSEVVATVLRKSTFSWDAPQLDALPYNVSCGLSPELVGTNLAYLRQLYGSYPDASTLVPSYQSASIPSHAFIGLKMVVLWFKCFGVDSDGIVGLCRLPGDADKRAFRSFLELRSDDSLGLPREMPPLVVDVTLLRSPSTRMMQLGTAVGRTYTREALTVALPSLVGEDWGFLSDGDASAAAVIDGIAAISAARYAASCNELRTNAPPHAQDFVTMYANEMLQPCFELLRAGMAGHAVRYCRTAASEAVVTCSDRGALALAALSRRNLELVEAVVGGDRPIPLSVRDEIAYFVRGCDALEQRDQRDELLRLLQDVTTEDTSPAQQSPCAVALHQIVESVQVMPTPSGVE